MTELRHHLYEHSLLGVGTTISGVGGVTAHSALTGLLNDDHTQYALLNGRLGGNNFLDQMTVAGNVGIGNTSPIALLQVGHSSSSPSSGSNCGILTRGGVSLFQQDPGSYPYQAELEVSNGTFYISSNAYYADGDHLYDSAKAPAQIKLQSTSANSYITFLTKAANTAAPIERIRIDKNGNMGIGTSSPTGRLEISGSTSIPSAYLQITGSIVNDTNYPGMVFKGGTLVTTYPNITMSNGGLTFWIAGGLSDTFSNQIRSSYASNAIGNAYFDVSVLNGVTITELLYIKDNGNVGIGGTSNPFCKLDINSVDTTLAKFGSVTPLYITNGSPLIGFNMYYLGGWKFGQGSSSLYAGLFGFAPATCGYYWYTSNAVGNADAAVGLSTVMTLVNKNLNISGSIQLGAVVDTPAAGMVQWNGSHFQGYNGATWVNLDQYFLIDRYRVTLQVTHSMEGLALLNRTTIPGEVILLRARLLDELSGVQQGTNMLVHIFEPNTTDFNPVDAYLVSGVPTYRGDGIYEYIFSVPTDASSGMWFDYWTGQLPFQTVSGLNGFNVVTGATIANFGSQLYNNNTVEVIIASGIMGTDGSLLSLPIALTFMTTSDPAYTDVRKVRLEVGAFVQDLEDDVLQESIVEASLQANAVKFSKFDYNTNLFKHARREYTTCLTARILLDNLSVNLGLRSKALGDLSVTYDPTMMIRMMDKLGNCLDKWEGQVITGGGARASTQPSMVVRGELDPDRPSIGRLWQTDPHGSVTRRIPAANTRERNRGQRRSHSTYYPFLTTPGWRRSW